MSAPILVFTNPNPNPKPSQLPDVPLDPVQVANLRWLSEWHPAVLDRRMRGIAMVVAEFLKHDDREAHDHYQQLVADARRRQR